MVRVRLRDWVRHYAYESPRKDRSTRMRVSLHVYVCVCVINKALQMQTSITIPVIKLYDCAFFIIDQSLEILKCD